MAWPLCLIIMDGFGVAPEGTVGNALTTGTIPNITKLLANNPHTTLKAAGTAVGLPKGQMGNSEVGHLNMGAGRIIECGQHRVTDSIKTGEFFQNPALITAIRNCHNYDSALHIVGLVSDGGVHSHIDHLYALLKLAHDHEIKKVYVHAILDGRDTSPTSGYAFLRSLEDRLKEVGAGKIASVVGRYYAMDRDCRWERVKVAYDAFVTGVGIHSVNLLDEVEKAYSEGITDEFMRAIILKDARLCNQDSVIFFNFRADRMRELVSSIADENFGHFKRKEKAEKICIVCMTQYDKRNNFLVAFPEIQIKNGFAKQISKCGLSQLRIAETEKYAHVTFFFSCGNERKFLGEDRILVPSPKVSTYDLAPQMSAYEITDKLCEFIKSRTYDFIVVNYANCDMVGHTGNFEATVAAARIVDECVGRVAQQIADVSGVAIITSDHGNAEQMHDGKQGVFTAHTLNNVPFILFGMNRNLREGGRLCDVAPTMLEILEIAQPDEMTGTSLFVNPRKEKPPKRSSR